MNCNLSNLESADPQSENLSQTVVDTNVNLSTRSSVPLTTDSPLPMIDLTVRNLTASQPISNNMVSEVQSPPISIPISSPIVCNRTRNQPRINYNEKRTYNRKQLS